MCRRGSAAECAVTAELVEIPLPAQAFELEEPRMDVRVAESPRTPGPGLELRPVPRGLTRYGPAGFRHELSLTPRMHGLGSHAEPYGNFGRADRSRLAEPTGVPARHGASVAPCSTCVKLTSTASASSRLPASGRGLRARWASAGASGRRVIASLALLVPGAVGLADLPRGHAVGLRAEDLLAQRARIRVEGLLQEPLGMPRGRARGVEGAVDEGPELGLDVAGGDHPVDEAHGARLLGPDAVVEQRQLLGPSHADDAGQPQDGAVGDQPVLGRAQPQDAILRGQPHVARHGELEPPADAVAVADGDHELVHVLQAIERPDPVTVERL